MKKIISTSFLVSVTIMFICLSDARANLIYIPPVGSTFYMNYAAGNDQSLGGGEFDFFGATGKFQTFCETHYEYFQLGMTYTIKEIETDISPAAASLYYHFRLGDLIGYDYTGAYHAKDMNDLQEALWWLESKDGGGHNDSVLGLQGDPNSPFVKVAHDYGWTDIGPVRGISYDWPPGYGYTNGQDVYGMVPEPATMLLLGSGLLGLAGYGRRRFLKK